MPRSGRVLTASRSMSSVFYKELKRHPLYAVHKVGAYYNVLSVTPTRKLSVASTKKQQQTNKQPKKALSHDWFVFIFHQKSVRWFPKVP